MPRVKIKSMMAEQLAEAGDERFVRATSWEGDVDVTAPDQAFRFFNRVDEDDVRRLGELNYHLPSLSVGDLLTIDDKTWRCESVGWSEVTA